MDNTPTAEEFVQNFLLKNHKGNVGNNNEKLMIEFAKLHVEAALKAVSEGNINRDIYMMTEYGESMDYKYSILNSYPLENIK
jgi:hypothetical protein